jgi:hypothetical protein
MVTFAVRKLVAAMVTAGLFGMIGAGAALAQATGTTAPSATLPAPAATAAATSGDTLRGRALRLVAKKPAKPKLQKPAAMVAQPAAKAEAKIVAQETQLAAKQTKVPPVPGSSQSVSAPETGPLPKSGCRVRGFLVNDYGKEGPARDAQALLDKDIAKWAGANGITKYKTGAKTVSCELFLNFVVFDEWTCTAKARVCW